MESKSDKERVKKLFEDYFLADVYLKAGDSDKAKAIVIKNINQKTPNPWYYYQMANLLAEENKQKSKEYLDIALTYWSAADANYIPLQRAEALVDKLSL